MSKTAIPQPISFWPEDLDFLRRKAQFTGQSLSSIVRQYVRADRATSGDLPTPNNGHEHDHVVATPDPVTALPA